MRSSARSVLFLLVIAALVTAAQVSVTHDKLKKSKGASACEVKDGLLDLCAVATKQGIDRWHLRNARGTPVPLPSTCTCNNIFFNIWSACSSQSGNLPSTTPTQWLDICSSVPINVTASLLWINSMDSLDVPAWTKVPDQEKGNVNVVTITPREETGGWTTFQKVLPVITAIAAVLLLIVAYILVRQWGFLARMKKGLKGVISNLRRTNIRQVKHTDRDTTWELDQSPTTTTTSSFVVIELPSPQDSTLNPEGEQSHWSNYSTPPIVGPGQGPGVLPKLTIPQLPRPHSSAPEWRLPGMATIKNIRQSISIPWKKTFVVTPVPHSKRFRIEDVDKNTDTSTPISRPSTWSHKTSTENGMPNARTYETIYEDDEDDSDDGTGIGRTENEHATLISDHERESNEVFLISRSGRDFTVESSSTGSPGYPRVNVLPPTPTSSSARSHGSMLSSILRVFPPAPSQPAPLPPSKRKSEHNFPPIVHNPAGPHRPVISARAKQPLISRTSDHQMNNQGISAKIDEVHSPARRLPHNSSVETLRSQVASIQRQGSDHDSNPGHLVLHQYHSKYREQIKEEPYVVLRTRTASPTSVLDAQVHTRGRTDASSTTERSQHTTSTSTHGRKLSSGELSLDYASSAGELPYQYSAQQSQPTHNQYHTDSYSYPHTHMRQPSADSLIPLRYGSNTSEHHTRRSSFESVTPPSYVSDAQPYSYFNYPTNTQLQAGEHFRRPLAESVIPRRTDPVMLFPGPVRGAGYMSESRSNSPENDPEGRFTAAFEASMDQLYGPMREPPPAAYPLRR